MITLQGAGAIVRDDDGRVLLIRVERRGMVRWELPTAIRNVGESLFMTVYRCVERESGFSLRVRIGRPVCLGLNRSEQLNHSYFGMFFECTAEAIERTNPGVPDIHIELPSHAKQHTLECLFVDWREVSERELHPQHRQILEQWADGSSFNLFAVESDADLEAEAYQQQSAATSNVFLSEPEVRPSTPDSVELKWIHLSDIHLGTDGSEAKRTLVLENLIEDVESNYTSKPTDYIFITGDVAFSGKDTQYKTALAWLERLASAAGVGLEAIWLVPGNHDVNRAAIDTNPTLKKLHVDARYNPTKIDEALEDPSKLKHLQAKLQPYHDWVTLHFKHIDSPLDWSTVLETRSSKRVLLAGLCTVWVSDKDDGSPNQPGTWSNNMFIGRERSLRALRSKVDTELTLLLTHHPKSWLARRPAQWLDSVLYGKRVVHLCGHVHEESAGVLFTMGDNDPTATIVAGAVYESEDWKHGYSWGQLRFEEGTDRWLLGWAPRTWSKGRFTADRNNFDGLDHAGFCWERLS